MRMEKKEDTKGNNSKAKSFLPERKIDENLWKFVKAKANGTVNEKLEAIHILFTRHYSLPQESGDLLRKLSSPTQPENIRLEIASSLSKEENKRIPYKLFSDLINTLAKDPDSNVRDAVAKSFEQYREQFTHIAQSILSAQQNIAEQFEGISRPSLLLQTQLSELSKISLNFPATQLIQLAESTQHVNEILSRQSLQFLSNYYSDPELKVVEKILPIEKQTIACKLKQGLYPFLETDKNKRNTDWKEFQDVCKSVLIYTLVPPLLQPLEESATDEGTQRRDLIFHIPHESEGFWRWIQLAYNSLALIVDCKNYGNELPANQVVITSKYFGSKRLGTFGIIITPVGFSSGAKAEQKRLWLEENDGKMILCLNGEDLIKMLELKENKEDPRKVIDGALRSFRQSLA